MPHADIIVGYHASASRTAKRTLVSTEMDAYELPKLIPTTVGTAETSIGVSAEPLGCGAIVEDSEETVGDNELDLERVWVLMGMEVWARARWEKPKMGTRTDPSAKDMAHRIPATRSDPIALITIIDYLITPWPELPEHDTWQPSFPIKTLAPSLTMRRC